MSASEPAFCDTAGVTTTDTTAVWTSLGRLQTLPAARRHTRGWPIRLREYPGLQPGNTIYVGSNHAETQATIITITPTGSLTTVARILCFNSAGSCPPTALATGATISTTGAVNLTFTPSGGGGFYLYGLAFKDAVGQSSSQNITLTANGSWIYCDACSFEIATTSATGTISVVGSGSGTTIFNNTTAKFAHTSQSLTVSGQFFWQNTGAILVSGSSVPTALMVHSQQCSFIRGAGSTRFKSAYRQHYECLRCHAAGAIARQGLQAECGNNNPDAGRFRINLSVGSLR